jgi:hypothetical protein
MGKPSFTRIEIGELENEVGSGAMNTLFNVGDLNGDGRTDIFTSGRNGRIAWFENKGEGRPWERHIIDEVTDQECGGLAFDLTGSGFPDVINGGDWRSDELSWWENPGPEGGRWIRRTIAKTGATQFHDEMIGDVTNDGRKSLVFWNQGGAAIYWTPLPEDPRKSPWPDLRMIARDMREGPLSEEGLAIADIDGDGMNEIVAGTHWYKYRGRDNEWERHRFAEGYITTVVAVGDADGDGANEILLSEGDPCIYGHPEGGKVGWFKPKADVRDLWEEHRMDEGLLDAHSLQIGDLCGNGRADVLVGEIGIKETFLERKPRLMVYENDGAGNFRRHVIDEGTGSHHARLADFRNRGILDIASRALHGPEKWKIFVWRNDSAGAG